MSSREHVNASWKARLSVACASLVNDFVRQIQHNTFVKQMKHVTLRICERVVEGPPQRRQVLSLTHLQVYKADTAKRICNANDPCQVENM